jgi:hypothetical protein
MVLDDVGGGVLVPGFTVPVFREPQSQIVTLDNVLQPVENVR